MTSCFALLHYCRTPLTYAKHPARVTSGRPTHIISCLRLSSDVASPASLCQYHNPSLRPSLSVHPTHPPIDSASALLRTLSFQPFLVDQRSSLDYWALYWDGEDQNSILQSLGLLRSGIPQAGESLSCNEVRYT